jgi:hypothetical protein
MVTAVSLDAHLAPEDPVWSEEQDHDHHDESEQILVLERAVRHGKALDYGENEGRIDGPVDIAESAHDDGREALDDDEDSP